MLVGRGCTEAVLSCTSTPKVKRVRLLITFQRLPRLLPPASNDDIRIAWLGFQIYLTLHSRPDQDADLSSSLTTHPGAALHRRRAQRSWASQIPAD